MSVETALGLHPDLPARIGEVWPTWASLRPALGQVADPTLLRRWLRHAPHAEADSVLHALAWVASPSGGDDTLAAQALAWSFLPAASRLAFCLRTLTEDIDHLVASELWACIRTFPLARRKVAANLVRDLRSRVLREHALATGGARSANVVVIPVDWTDDAWLADQAHAAAPTAAEELLDVLDWACDRGLITAQDRALLLHLVDVAANTVCFRSRTGFGLLSDASALEVGRRLGISGTTVKRNARRALDALASEASLYLQSA